MNALSNSDHRHPERVSGSILPHDWSDWLQTQSYRQISPMRISVVDEIDFPWPVPILQLFLTGNCAGHVAKYFELNKAVHAVFCGKAVRMFVTMLVHTLDQIGRNADVQRAVILAGQDIDARLLFFSHKAGDAVKWTLKQVQGDGFSYKHRYLQNQRHAELVSASIVRFIQFKLKEQSSQNSLLEAAK